MPITKFSWPQLREHIRKFLWIYLAGIVVCLFGSNLIWTMTRPQVPIEQAVLVYMADAYSNPDPLNGIAQDMLVRGQEFDETLQQVEFQSLQFSDPNTDYTSSMVMMARLSTGEGDVFLASEDALNYLIGSGATLPLDDYVANGWLSQYDLEPYYATVVTDEETGETETFMAALRLDEVDALLELEAFNNEGAYLVIASNGTNIETSMKTVEIMIEDLMEGNYHVATESTEPVA